MSAVSPTLYWKYLKKATLAGFLASYFLFPNIAAARVPGDPRYADQAPIWQRINAPAAWDFTVGVKKVVIATIDTGVDTWHEDLRNNIWVNPYEIADNGIDDDRNGYVDDINGWNFVENNNAVRPSVFNTQDDPEAVRHGTLIAGLLGAAAGNGRDGVGLNWKVQIMPLRAIDSRGNGAVSSVIRAVEYAVKNHATIITMSFVGEEDFFDLHAALRSAYDQGIVVVAAVGNDRLTGRGNLTQFPTYPACFDRNDTINWVLGVSAVSSADQPSVFANFGSCVDLFAPGENIFSTERFAPQFNYLNEFGGGWSGTSFAAPLVAGAAGLIAALRPDWSAPEIINTLLSGADAVPVTNTPGVAGIKRLNVGRAVAVAAVGRPAAPAWREIIYHTAHELLLYDLERGEAETLKRLPDATIVSAARADLAGDRQFETVLLIQRENHFFLHLITETGKLWREFALSLPSALAAKQVKILESETDEPRLVVASTDRARGATTFTVYSLEGTPERSVKIQFSGLPFAVDSINNKLLWIERAGGRLRLHVRDLDSLTGITFPLVGFSTVDDLAVGRVWPGTGRQAALIGRKPRGGQELMVIDWESRSSQRRSLAGAAGRTPARLLLGDVTGDDQLEIFWFRAAGGIFPVETGRGGLVQEVRVPTLSGTID